MKSSFIAVDLELTGIKSDLLDRYEELPFERYIKVKHIKIHINL